MYILVKESIPTGFAINSAAHVSLMTYLKFEDRREMQGWLEKSFRKVTCAVSDAEFEEAKKYDDYAMFVEGDLDDTECALGFCPREHWPEFFRTLRLYGADNEETRDTEVRVGGNGCCDIPTDSAGRFEAGTG